MPGIAGIVSFSSKKASMDKDIRRMVTILDHTSPSAQEICVTDHAAIGTVGLKVHSLHGLVAENSSTTLAFWGCLWNREDLKKRIGDDYSNWNIRDTSIGKLLLRLYTREGTDGLCNLNGRFVIAIWDKSSKSLTLVNDCYGFCKLFYWVSHRRILFASEYKAIIWHQDFQKKIDEQGLADFMMLGYSTGNGTFFKDVQLLPPASVATFKTDGTLSIQRYWDYSFHGDDDPLWLEEDYLDQFVEILTRAMERQSDWGDIVGLPLSGGLDSRTLAGVLDRSGFAGEVKAFSYGHPYAYDVVNGKKIAENLGYEHTYIPIESSYLSDHAERFVWLLEGSSNCFNAHILLTYPFIRKNSLHTIITGFFGDISCGSGAAEYFSGIRGKTDDEDILRQQYDAHVDIMKDEDLAVHMKDNVYRAVSGRTFEAFRSRYFQCPSRNRFFRTRYLGIHERHRRYVTFNLYLFDLVAEVASPFLDRDFVQFVYHVPAELVVFRNLYKKVIVKYLPRVASVPHNETKLPLNASWVRKGLQWRWERLMRNPLIRVTIGRQYARLNDNYHNTHEAIRTGSRDFVEKSIRNNEFLAQFFKMRKLNELLDNHINGKVHEPTKITALLTFALWGKMFVDNQKPTFQVSSNR
jgi:asparagine synthase (glutamine-hydrolysing)